MIASLRGRVIDIELNALVLEVSGVGYFLGISRFTAQELSLNDECFLYVRMLVREDAQLLFGFKTKIERSLFDQLINISGIGPKLALSILSSYEPFDLTRIALQEDLKALEAISGVGKKSAQRIMVELKSIFEKDNFKDIAQAHTDQQQSVLPLTGGALLEARSALEGFGFSAQEIQDALAQIPQDTSNVSEIISRALRYLGGRS